MAQQLVVLVSIMVITHSSEQSPDKSKLMNLEPLIQGSSRQLIRNKQRVRIYTTPSMTYLPIQDSPRINPLTLQFDHQVHQTSQKFNYPIKSHPCSQLTSVRYQRRINQSASQKSNVETIIQMLNTTVSQRLPAPSGYSQMEHELFKWMMLMFGLMCIAAIIIIFNAILQ